MLDHRSTVPWTETNIVQRHDYGKTQGKQGQSICLPGGTSLDQIDHIITCHEMSPC